MRDGAKTRERICAEALALFARKGVDGSTVRDIAQAVGVSEGALYRHFRSKEDIAREIFATRYAALARDVLEIGMSRDGLEARIGALARRFTGLFDEEPALFAFLLVNQHQHLGEVSGAAAENPVEALRAVFAEAMARREIAPGDADLLAAMALGLVVQPAVFRIYGRLTGSLGQHAPQITRALMATLRPT
ncbi:TetR/AcrR family transcriptional regulator [Alsobacter sp. SYSU BS001988]|jgi:AcrR family transcriptional regulator